MGFFFYTNAGKGGKGAVVGEKGTMGDLEKDSVKGE